MQFPRLRRGRSLLNHSLLFKPWPPGLDLHRGCLLAYSAGREARMQKGLVRGKRLDLHREARRAGRVGVVIAHRRSRRIGIVRRVGRGRPINHAGMRLV